MKRYVFKITHYLIILLVLGFLIIPTFASAKTKIPTQTNEFYVNDFADVLTDNQEKELVQKAKSYADNNNGIQVVITTVKSLDGETLEYYAHDMYNQYGIGKDDMGVLILLVTQDRDIRMEIGTAMEAYINDAKAGRMIDIYAIEHFKNDEFAEGLIELQEGTFKEITAMTNGEESTVPEEDNSWIIILVLVVGGAIALIFILVLIETDGFENGMMIGSLLSDISSSSSDSSESSGSSGFGGHSSGGGASRHF